jgi:hypothetical protein
MNSATVLANPTPVLPAGAQHPQQGCALMADLGTGN